MSVKRRNFETRRATQAMKRARESPPGTPSHPSPGSTSSTSVSPSSQLSPSSGPPPPFAGEVLFFHRPNTTETTLWVANLPEEVSHEHLYAVFAKYGPIFEISPLRRVVTSFGCYVFISYYSAYSAQMAKFHLHGTKFLGQACTIQFKSISTTQIYELDIKSCISLANYYIGWNEWSSQLLTLQEQEMIQLPNGVWRGTFVSAVKLIFKIDGLSITGQGQGTHECPERWMVRKYARKKAVTDAMKCAWNAVCIVLLPGGKRTIHLLPRSLNYWMANTGDNTDDTNFEQPVDESVQR